MGLAPIYLGGPVENSFSDGRYLYLIPEKKSQAPKIKVFECTCDGCGKKYQEKTLGHFQYCKSCQGLE